MTSLERPSPLDQVLRILADVRPGEGRKAALLALNIFFIMGDVVSAAIVFLGTRAGLTAFGFAKLNVVLAAAFRASPFSSVAPTWAERRRRESRKPPQLGS